MAWVWNVSDPGRLPFMRLFLTAVWLAAVFTASAQTRFTQYYNSIADLKAATPNPLSTASVVKYFSVPASVDTGGVFYYDGSSVAADDGVTIIKPNNGVGRWIRTTSKSGGGSTGTPAWLNVKDPPYNAKGDGVTDDTVAIDTAVAALSTNNPVLYFPSGRYPRSTTMTMPTFKGWSIIGNSRFDTQILYSGATNAIYVGAPLGNSAQLHALIKDISIVANGSGANANGLHIANCYKVQVLNVAVSGFGNSGVLIDPLQVSDQVGIIQLTALYTTGNKYGLKIGHTSNNIHDIHVDGDSDFDGNTQYNLWMWANAFGFDIKGNSFYFGPNSSATNIYIDSIGGGTIHGNYIEGGQAAVVFANSGGSTVPPAAISLEGNGIQGSHTNATAVQYGIAGSDRLNAIGARNNWITGFTNGFNFIGIVNNALIGPNYFTSTVTNQYTPLLVGSTATIVNSNYFMPGIRVGSNGTFNLYDNSSQAVLQIEGLKEYTIFDNVTGLTRMILKTNGNWGFSTAAPTAPFSVNSAMDVKGLTNLNGVLDLQGGNASSLATPALRLLNDRMLVFLDKNNANTLAGGLWMKSDNTFSWFNGNSSLKGVSIDTNGDVTLPGGSLLMPNNKFHQNKDTAGTYENVVGIDGANNLVLGTPTIGGGGIFDIRKGDQTLKARFATNVIPWTLSSNLFAITAPFTASQGVIVTGGTTNQGDGTIPGGIRLGESNGVNNILIQGRDTLNATITNKWPGTNVSGILQNDGAGKLEWVAASGSTVTNLNIAQISNTLTGANGTLPNGWTSYKATNFSGGSTTFYMTNNALYIDGALGRGGIYASNLYNGSDNFKVTFDLRCQVLAGSGYGVGFAHFGHSLNASDTSSWGVWLGTTNTGIVLNGLLFTTGSSSNINVAGVSYSTNTFTQAVGDVLHWEVVRSQAGMFTTVSNQNNGNVHTMAFNQYTPTVGGLATNGYFGESGYFGLFVFNGQFTVSNYNATITVPSPLTTLFVGDSVVNGFQATSASQSWASQTGKALDGGFTTFGCSGDASQQTVLELPQILAMAPIRVIINLGLNNATAGTLSQYQTDLTNIVTQLTNAGVDVIVAAPNAATDRNSFPYYDWLRTQYPSKFIDLYTATKEVQGTNLRANYTPADHQAHPNQAGHDAMANTAIAWLRYKGYKFRW